jgi:Tfp pilus assembly protein PilX
MVSNQRGIALVVAMLVLMVLSLLAVVLMATITTDKKVGAHSTRESAALNVADAGIGEACARLRNQDINLNNNPRGVAQIFNCTAGTVPVLGVDSTGYATAQAAGQWLRYTNATRGAGTLTVTYKTNAARTLIYKYDNTKNPAVQTATGMPIYVVTSTGREGADTRTVVAEVFQKPINLAINGAFAGGQSVQFAGNAFCCGYDHRADTPAGTGASGRFGGGGCAENLAANPPQWEYPTGTLPGLWTTGAPGGSTPGGNADGAPQLSEGNATFYAGPWESLGMSQAEFFGWVGPSTAVMPASPNGLYYLDNNATTQDATGAWSANSGSGLLYVDGDLTLNNGFTWRGLIYTEGDIKVNGSAWVLGSVIAKGKSAIKFNGGATVLYSNDAIQQTLTKFGGKFSNLSWIEKQ